MLTIIAARCYASVVYAVMRCLSVCLSVHLSHSWILSKPVIVSSIFSHRAILVFPYLMSWQYSDGDPLTGASNAGGAGTNRDSGRTAGYRSMTVAVCDQHWRSSVQQCITATTHVYGTDRHASVNTPKRREQNLFVRSGKSEAEVTNNRRLRSTYCTIEANYWQTRSIARPFCDSRATCSAVRRISPYSTAVCC